MRTTLSLIRIASSSVTILFIILWAVSGCASNSYTDNGDNARMQAALTKCQKEAIHEHFKDNYSGLGAAVGGAVGGLLTGISSKPGENVNQLIQACMARNGYVGESHG